MDIIIKTCFFVFLDCSFCLLSKYIIIIRCCFSFPLQLQDQKTKQEALDLLKKCWGNRRYSYPWLLGDFNFSYFKYVIVIQYKKVVDADVKQINLLLFFLMDFLLCIDDFQFYIRTVSYFVELSVEQYIIILSYVKLMHNQYGILWNGNTSESL